MKPACHFITLLICGMILGFSFENKKDHWIPLFNGKNLSGWDTYIGPDLNDSGKFISDKPIGLNNDPRHVFTVVSQDGENIIRISGENWGAISTKAEFENYHFSCSLNGAHFPGDRKRIRKKTVVYFIIQLVNTVQIMAPGCVHRNFRLKKPIVGTTGVLPAEWLIFR